MIPIEVAGPARSVAPAGGQASAERLARHRLPAASQPARQPCPSPPSPAQTKGRLDYRGARAAVGCYRAQQVDARGLQIADGGRAVIPARTAIVLTVAASRELLWLPVSPRSSFGQPDGLHTRARLAWCGESAHWPARAILFARVYVRGSGVSAGLP